MRRNSMQFKYSYWLMMTYSKLEDRNINPLDKVEDVANEFMFYFNMPLKRARSLVEQYNKYFYKES